LVGDWYTRSHKLFYIRKVGGMAMEAVVMYRIVGYLPDMACWAFKNNALVN